MDSATSAAAGPRLSPYRAVKDYLFHMLSSVAGLKALILDGDNAGVPVQGTIQRISAVESTQGLGKQGVFFTEKLQDPRSERVGHLKAVVWVRPIDENIELLSRELRDPKYGEYHIFFTNHSPGMGEYIKRLALADEFELVRNIGEYYSDFVAVSPELFSLNTHHHSGRNGWDQGWREDVVSGLLSALLSLRAKPVVRYSARSPTSRKLAQEIGRRIRAAEDDTRWVSAHWDAFQDQALQAQMALGRSGGTTAVGSGGGGSGGGGGGGGGPDAGAAREGDTVLLIVDRADDPVTPLMHQWTYQAMIYDMIEQSSEKLLGNNLVQFRPTAARLKDEGEQMINLSCEQDRFYRENRFTFWPSVLEEIDGFQAKYKKMREEHRDVLEADHGTRERSLSQAEDHKDRVKEVVAQQFTTREETANMQKHIALAAELDHLVRQQRANELGSLEQRLVFSDSSQAQEDMDALKDLLYGSEGSPTLRSHGRSSEESYRDPLSVEGNPLERERLLVLFALRHHETLWPSAKVRGGQVAAARVKGGQSTALGDEFEKLCEGGGELELIKAVITPCRGGYHDGSSCTPGLFDNMRKSKERQARRLGRGQEEYELLQHRPRIDCLLKELAQGELSDGDYPVMRGSGTPAAVRNIVVFGIGGVTFSEARMVHEFNQQQRQEGKECLAVLGGDFITNAMEFLSEHRLAF